MKTGASITLEVVTWLIPASVVGKALIWGGRALRLTKLARRVEKLARSLKFTGTVAKGLCNPARHVPTRIIADVIVHGKKVPDPQGVAGLFMYYGKMIRNGKEYAVEVLLRPADNTVFHVLYR